MTISVIGGTYDELCQFPLWRQTFGSAGRAAAAIASLGGSACLHTFSSSDGVGQRQALADLYGFELAPTVPAPNVAFDYFHALSPIHITPSDVPLYESERVIDVTVAEMIFGDNAWEFHGGATRAGCDELGISLAYCPSRAPWFKGRVERFMRTIAEQLFHLIPGTTWSNTKDRGEYPSEKLACVTLEQLTVFVVRWIVECYQHAPHRGLKGKTPFQAWQESARLTPIYMPADPDQLSVAFSDTIMRPITNSGVTFDQATCCTSTSRSSVESRVLAIVSPVIGAIRWTAWVGSTCSSPWTTMPGLSSRRCIPTRRSAVPCSSCATPLRGTPGSACRCAGY
ncbi:integrase [Burkholderia lata]|nr:integrase [Burkholderia lata]